MLEWLRSKLKDSDEPEELVVSQEPHPYLAALHYPAEPEKLPEPSPFEVINRRYKYTGQGLPGFKEPRKRPPAYERPMKLPGARSYDLETIRSAGIPSVFDSVTPPLKSGKAGEPDWEHMALPAWDECVANEAGMQDLPAFGWATVEQRDWIQELKRQLISRREAECQSGRLGWVHPEYQAKFKDVEALCWMAARTGMTMFDFNEMLQWERENGIGRGLFDTDSGAYDYRRSSFL